MKLFKFKKFLPLSILFFLPIFFLLLLGFKGEGFSNEVAKEKLSHPYLVVDLDGNGFELSSLEKSTIYTDVDGDGLSEKTVWPSKNEGILMILSLKRLQDNNGIVAATHARVSDGLSDLIENFDLNQDGTYNEKDVIPYGKHSRSPGGVNIWQDRNSNGFPEKSEISGDISFVDYKKNENDTFVIGLKDGRNFKVKPISLAYEDTNAAWTLMCDGLEYAGSGYYGSDHRSQDLCLSAGYRPANIPADYLPKMKTPE